MRKPALIAGSPRLPSTFIPRMRLWGQLDRATRGSVTALVAPAGAGKTLGVSGWLHDHGETEAIWVNADATWEPSRLDPQLRLAADRVGGDPRSGSAPVLVVIDDAHQLPATSVRMLDDRLDKAPETLRLLLLGRWDLPLTRLVPELLGHYTSLRGDVLRLDDKEVAELVAAHLGAADPAVIDVIAAHANGWCAAVVLAAHAVAAEPEPAAAALDYTRGYTQIADRVASEVFASLQPQDRHVLLCVGGEHRVTASAAVHLSHDLRAPETLARLDATGLLVSRIETTSPSRLMDDDPDPTYRIHPLLTEVIRRRLVSGGVDVVRARATVARAVRLDLARGDRERSFSRLLAVHDIDLAAEVLATEGITMALRGDGSVISTFVDRHPDVIDARPDTWFTVALDRWLVDDVGAARHWLDRWLGDVADGVTSTAPDPPLVACARLMRARIGLGSLRDAVDQAQLAADSAERDSHSAGLDVLPHLRIELGVSQNWLGELRSAEANLVSGMELCRHRGLTALAAAAASHLAFTEYMAGRERAAVEIATEALSLLGSALPQRAPFAGSRATLALLLAGLVDLPWPANPIETSSAPASTHSADPCTRFWLRMRDARLALLAGSAAEAERALTMPLEAPTADEHLPLHLQVAVLVERAFLAALAGDRSRLGELRHRLVTLGTPGEAALVDGLRADVAGDRRGAASAFALAATSSSSTQPASRALALVCQAQLLDALGESSAALNRLREAANATEVRRNAVPFLGWTRQGTPVGILLTRLERLGGPEARWVRELAAAAKGSADITSVLAPTTATTGERPTDSGLLVRTLSPRERDVLRELARGATYADIAASLFVSENTVKTHISSLYGKLAVSRRSEALAVARSLQLL